MDCAAFQEFNSGGRLGVVVCSTGPGSGYAVPGLLEALGSSSPVLMITMNIATRKIDKDIGTLHETRKQHEIFGPATKARFTLRGMDDVQGMMHTAVRLALSGRLVVGLCRERIRSHRQGEGRNVC